MSLTITGEAGKGLDATPREFSEVGAEGTLRFGSLEPDELTFTLLPDAYDGAGETIPTEGQEITLHNGSTRIFTGVVSVVKSDWKNQSLQIEIKVVGPWFWLESTPLSELISDGVSPKERPRFECPKGDIRAHIIRLMQRCQALGLPVTVGNIDLMYDVPKITLTDGSFADALAELLRLVPDAMPWWSYQVAGNPRLNIHRRDTGNATDLAIGSDQVSAVALEQQLGLEVREVVVPYASRSNGAIRFNTQSYGAAPGIGKRQIFVVSGPEKVDFLPSDLESPATGGGSDTVSTTGAGSTPSQSVLKRWWPWWLTAQEEPGALNPTFSPFVSGVVGAYYPGGTAPDYLSGGSPVSSSWDEVIFADSGDQDPLPGWVSQHLSTQSATIIGTYWTQFFITKIGSTFPPPTSFQQYMIDEADHVHDTLGATQRHIRLFYNVSVPVTLTDTELSNFAEPVGGGEIEEAFGFETPPAGFAQSLHDAQNWAVFAGSVDLDPDLLDYSRFQGKTLNILGGRSVWENMGALVQSEVFSLDEGTHTLELGTPPRLSGTNLTSRLRRQSGDSVFQF